MGNPSRNFRDQTWILLTPYITKELISRSIMIERSWWKPILRTNQYESQLKGYYVWIHSQGMSVLCNPLTICLHCIWCLVRQLGLKHMTFSFIIYYTFTWGDFFWMWLIMTIILSWLSAYTKRMFGPPNQITKDVFFICLLDVKH